MLEIPIQSDIKDDLAVIDNIENLKTSPFVTLPKKRIFKPPTIPSTESPVTSMESTIPSMESPVTSMESSKESPVTSMESDDIVSRPKTAKKKKELSEKQKAHLLKMRQKKIDKTNAKLSKNHEIVHIEATPEELAYMEAKEFDHWLSQMEKFEKMIMKKREAENKIREAELKKEAILEAKIRKKIELENQQRQGNTINKIPEPPVILKQNDFGEYSSFFGY